MLQILAYGSTGNDVEETSLDVASYQTYRIGLHKVYVGIGGQSLRTVRNVVSRDLEEEAIISEELVSAIGDENSMNQVQ